MEQPAYLSQGQRVAVLVTNAAIFCGAYFMATGEWMPASGGGGVWFWSAISMWLLSLLAAPWFTPPRDALTAAVTAGVLLATMDLSRVIALAAVLDAFRWGAFGLAVLTIASALAAILLRNRDTRSGFGEVCYRLSENLGRSEVVFTPPALLSIAGFYQASVTALLGLMVLWVFFVVVRPSSLPSAHGSE